MTVTITAVNALQYGDEIKELFLTHERPEFSEAFDRAYPPAFAAGATSWIGRDRSGRLVMHTTCFPRRFRFQGREVGAGLMLNLMVAKECRSFFPALELMKRVVRDLQARGDMDFVYADPNAVAASLLRFTPFARFATLRRYVLPVSHARTAADLAVRLFHRLVRAAIGAPQRSVVVPHSATQFRAEPFWAPPKQLPRLSPYHDHTHYVSRMSGYPSDTDWWFTCHRPERESPPEAALLVRGPDASGWATLQAVRWAPGVSPASFLPGLIAELRRRGCNRLQLTTVAESDLGRAMVRCGFVPRADPVPLFAAAFTPLGDACIRAVKEWEITDLDCDRGV